MSLKPSKFKSNVKFTGATLPLQLRRQLLAVHPPLVLHAEALRNVLGQLLAGPARVRRVADVDTSLCLQLFECSLRSYF